MIKQKYIDKIKMLTETASPFTDLIEITNGCSLMPRNVTNIYSSPILINFYRWLNSLNFDIGFNYILSETLNNIYRGNVYAIVTKKLTPSLIIFQAENKVFFDQHQAFISIIEDVFSYQIKEESAGRNPHDLFLIMFDIAIIKTNILNINDIVCNKPYIPVYRSAILKLKELQ